jgi:YNFM family putative membrane transporter
MQTRTEDFIRHGTPAFRRTNLALFAAGLATFGLMYCVQPLLPEFSREFGVSAAASALSLSLTSGVLAVAILVAGPISDAWGRKALMTASLLSSALIVLLTAIAPSWQSLLMLRAVLGLAVGGLAGRLVAGVLADFCGWRIGTAVVGMVGALAGWVFVRNLPPSRHFVRLPLRLRSSLSRFAGVFHDPGLRWLFAEGFVLLGAFVTL